MEIIVADANVFVYLFRCGLLEKFLSGQHYEIKITKSVEEEISHQNRRISREHPDLRGIILDSLYNSSSHRNLYVVDINKKIQAAESMEVYYKLRDEGELDLGEIESIPLALELDAKFLSNDEDAIETANEIQKGLGINFINFCKGMLSTKIINADDMESILGFMKDY